MHQEPLARAQATAHEDIAPNGEIGLTKGGGLIHRHGLRDRQRMILMGHGIFGIAAAWQQGTNRIPDFPFANTSPHSHDNARSL